MISTSSSGRRGFLLIEVLLGLGVFSIFVAAAMVTLVTGQEGVRLGGNRSRSLLLAEGALEGVKSIRDDDFALLTPGQHGVALDDAGRWVFAGTGTVTPDGFTTSVTIVSLESDRVQATARTLSWRGSVPQELSLAAEFTDWRSSLLAKDWTSVSLEGSFVDSGTPLFNRLAVSGNYAFISSETSDGGVGLYIFDISNLSAPARVATSFSLGVAGYGLLVKDSTLYLLAADSNAELRAYDISSPATFSSANLLTSYNLPGSGLGVSLALKGDTLFVGATHSAVASQYEFYSFNVSTPSSIALLDSLEDSGTAWDIGINGEYAYLGSSMDSSEIRVVDVSNPADLRFASGEGYNLNGSQDGTAVSAFALSVLLGRSNATTLEELTLFDVSNNPVPSSPPSPVSHEIAGTVNALDVDSSACYGFAATDFSNKELQVVRVQGSGLPEVGYYNTTTGAGRGVLYDEMRDRAYMVTNKAFLIFKPGSSSAPCIP